MPRDVEGPIAKAILHKYELLAPRYVVIDKVIGQFEARQVGLCRFASRVDDDTTWPLTRVLALLGESSHLAARLRPIVKFTWAHSLGFGLANNAVGRLVSGIRVFEPHLDRLSCNRLSKEISETGCYPSTVNC